MGPIRRMLALATVLAAAAILAGCDEDRIISRVHQAVGYDKIHVMRTVSVGWMPVVIQGSPLSSPIPDSDIAARLAMPDRFPPAIFRTVPPNSLPEKGHLVLLFNAPETINAYRVCKDETLYPSTGPVASGFTVSAVFCLDGDWIARGHMRQREIDGIEDPVFAAGMTAIFEVMFPVRVR